MKNRQKFLILTALVLSTLACLGQQKKTITPDDILDLRVVSSPQISPDNKWVAFVVGQQGGWGPPRQPHIWMVGTDGKTPARVFAASVQGESSPRWSPDGRYLCFISKRPNPFKPNELVGDERFDVFTKQREREATPSKAVSSDHAPRDVTGSSEAEEPTSQIWMMRIDGGEAIPITSANGAVQSFELSPDGNMVAFTVSDPTTEEEKGKKIRKDDAIYVDHTYKFARLWLLDFRTGVTKRVLDQDVNVNGISWSPDGKQLALLVSATPRPVDYWYLSKLIVVDRESGKTVRTISDKATIFDVKWSPDGRNLLYGTYSPSGISGRATLLAVSGGEPRTLDGDYRGTISSMKWRGNSNELIAWGFEGTEARLLSVDANTSRIETLASIFSEFPDIDVSADGKLVAFIGQGNADPSDIWVMETGKEPRQLTQFHPQVASWNLGTVRQVRWKNKKDGKTIYGVLVTPPDFKEGKPYPTVVQIHGGPEWAWWSGWVGSWHEWGQLLASHGYVVLMPNPRGSDGQGWEFTEAVRNDWGGMDFEDIMSGVEDLVAKKIVDPERLGIGGWSYGGFMSSWAVTHTDRFKAAVIGAGVTDLISFAGTTDIMPSFTERYFDGNPFKRWEAYGSHSPLTYLNQCKTPSLILHGEADPRVPVSQGWEFYNGLKMLGVPAEMVIYPREPHGINERAHQADLLTRILGWYDQYLKR